MSLVMSTLETFAISCQKSSCSRCGANVICPTCASRRTGAGIRHSNLAQGFDADVVIGATSSITTT